MIISKSLVIISCIKKNIYIHEIKKKREKNYSDDIAFSCKDGNDMNHLHHLFDLLSNLIINNFN